MTWTKVTIPRQRASVGMPHHCVYCNGRAEQDLTLRARREMSKAKGRMTTTRLEEHLAIEVPYCRTDATRSMRLRREIRRLGIGAGIAGIVIGLVIVVALLDAPLDVKFVLGVLTGIVLGLLALLSLSLLVRRLPRYRDWGAGLLGVDLAAGAEVLTFRFSNPAFAATFRTQNGHASANRNGLATPHP